MCVCVFSIAGETIQQSCCYIEQYSMRIEETREEEEGFLSCQQLIVHQQQQQLKLYRPAMQCVRADIEFLFKWK